MFSSPWVWFVLFASLTLGGLSFRIDQMARDLSEIKAILRRQTTDEALEQALQDRIIPLIRQGRKIEAIKIVRNTRQCSLMKAKEWVDALSARIS